MFKTTDYKKYVHKGTFLRFFAITESDLKEYSSKDFIRTRRMSFSGVRLYNIEDGPVALKMNELRTCNNLEEYERYHAARYFLGRPNKVKICYSRVDDESKKDVLMIDKYRFKCIEDAEIIQECGSADDLSREQWTKIRQRIKNDEIRSIYVLSTNALADKLFPIIKLLLDSSEVKLYIITNNSAQEYNTNEDSIDELIIKHKEAKEWIYYSKIDFM